MAWFCRGHSPPLSQTGQSSGWLISRNSMIPCCALSATGLVACVLTTMPSATVIVHEACGLGKPRPLPASGTSTRHCRHAPTGASSGWSQKRGIWTPTCSAARITRVSLGTLTWTPSMVRVTRSSARSSPAWSSCSRSRSREDGRGGGVEGAPAVGEVGDVLVAEVLDRAGDRADRTVGERAERAAEDVVALVEQELEVGLGTLSLLQRRQRLHQPPGALAAGRALAAGLVLVELGPAQHRPHDAGGVVEELQRLGAEHRAGLADALVVQGYVEVL